MKVRVLGPAFALIALALAVASFGTAAAQGNDLPAAAAIPTNLPSPVIPVVPTVAPGYSAPNTAPPSASIVGVSGSFVGISLQDAVGMALLKNPNLAVSASNMRIAHYQIIEAKAPFDLRFLVEPSTSFSVQQPQNALFAGPGSTTVVPSPGPIFGITGLPTYPPTLHNAGDIIQHQYGWQYGLGGQTLSGTKFTAGIQQLRTYNNVTFNSYNPYYIASLNLNVTQPLLKDLGMNAAKHQLRLAFINADNSSEQALVDASNSISKVDDTYWDLVAAWRAVAIQEDALQNAVAQQHSNVRLARHGAAAPITAVEATTQVAQFQDSVYSALQNVASLQNQLKSLIVTDPNDPIWMANLVPISPVGQLPSAPDLDGIVATAQQDRPEMRQAFDKYAAAGVDLQYAKNQLLPAANLQVGYQSNGFAGLPLSVPPGLFGTLTCSSSLSTKQTYCPTVPAITKGTMPQAYHNLWTGAFPAFNVNFTVSFPLQNSNARGLRATADQEREQADIYAHGVLDKIGFEARNALQSYQAAVSRLSAARVARESAEAVFASEQRRFRNGESTTFLVLQRQIDLDQALGRELQAQTDMNKSIVELQRVQGTILSDNGVNLTTLGTRALAAPANGSTTGEKKP